MTHSATLRCISGCDGTYAFDTTRYRCASCGGLLEVAHDLDALRQRGADAWRATFDERYGRAAWPYGSGVWGKHEWVAPWVDDTCIVSLGEGLTPLVPVPRLARRLGVGELLVKMCGQSPTGSFKDLGMTVLVSSVKQMIAGGRAIRAIGCASTGDTSAALAAYAAAAGVPALVILPRGKVTPAQLVQPLASGATVLSVDGDFDDCMAIMQRLADEDGVYLANSLNSLRLEGQKTVAIELTQQLGWQLPDVVVVPGGNLGNVSALQAGFEMMRGLGLTSRVPRLVVAQAEAANPLYLASRNGWQFEAIAARRTWASAIQIGNPVSITKAVRAIVATSGTVEQASEAELSAAATDADAAGLFVCPHTAVALAALAKLARRGDVTEEDRVVVLSTANGLKFTDFTAASAARPVEVQGDYDAVRRALDRAVLA